MKFGLWSTLTVLIGCSVTAVADDREDFFESRIRPVLISHCYRCHGPEEASGKLRLDSKTGWMRGGESGPAIVPGDPAASLLYRAVTQAEDDLKMPPAEEGEKLTEQQLQDFATWIRQGAIDPRVGDVTQDPIDVRARTHWAFQPLQAPKVPKSEHPVDFLLARQLENRDFRVTSAADLRTRIRRATYDLHGLPPTATQLATSSEEFPQLIAELLASPRYGEHWGRHWLDVARYSDAKDGVLMYDDARIRPFAYTYRDYVIRAFNEDKPFDDFVRQQIAADQMGLSPHDPDLAGMGFLTLGRMFDSNPHDVVDDRIDVISRGFLGLTVSCARCHDHKFDPLPTADYYSLYGVFASSIEPYQRPRIEEVTSDGEAYEKELNEKLEEVFETQQSHYDRLLKIARDRTPDYLVQVATTEPDISETSIFFLSLLPDQLRPQITYRWRQLIARRAYAEDPIFGPWHDLMREPVLQVERWKEMGVDARLIAGLAATQPLTPTTVARTYGEVIRGVWGAEEDLQQAIATIDRELALLGGGPINLSDIVAGGNGFGMAAKGHGIHPGTGEATTGETGFITIEKCDEWIAVPSNPFVDGVFVPKTSVATVSSTGLQIADLPPTSGQTWDYFKYGPSGGFTVNTINGIDYNAEPNWILGIHANKGITFDLQAFRDRHEFQAGHFQAVFGHGGAKDESTLDVAVFLDGKRVMELKDFAAQQAGHPIDVALPEAARFLTLVVTEGGQGLTHDQAILGNPEIVPDANQRVSPERQNQIASLERQRRDLQEQIKNLPALEGDVFADLLLAQESPVWFPKHDLYHYLSRQAKDSYRGLVNQLDAISVKHHAAAGRAMVMVDRETLYEPVIFQRGDPTQRGTAVPRQFLQIVAGPQRIPFSRGSGRLELADAIASPDNPLTARVWVNRVWMHHFGFPLVADPSDFGLRTERPVQNELLDYLATSFIASGWRTKPLHTLIMTSAAYQRDSRIPSTVAMAQQLETDPQNTLLWRANRRRLSLEQMRDTMLVLSGEIDYTMFGRPPHITDLENRRRTVYAFVERQNVPDVVRTFDFANADTSTARRILTTVPQQALYVMNAEFIQRTAAGIANSVSEGTDEERLARCHDLVFGRLATSAEIEMGLAFVEANSWEQYAQVLLMTNELMFID